MAAVSDFRQHETFQSMVSVVLFIDLQSILKNICSQLLTVQPICLPLFTGLHKPISLNSDMHIL